LTSEVLLDNAFLARTVENELMALEPNYVKTSRSGHVMIIPASATGIFVVQVGLGRKMQINIDNPGGSTFNLVGYLFSEDEAAEGGFTRTLAEYETGLTNLKFNSSSITAVKELGIEVTAATASTIQIEILESKL